MNLPAVPFAVFCELFEDRSVEMFRRFKRPVVRRFAVHAEVRDHVREIDKAALRSMKSASVPHALHL